MEEVTSESRDLVVTEVKVAVIFPGQMRHKALVLPSFGPPGLSDYFLGSIF